MARTPFFRRIDALWRVAARCERSGEPVDAALQRLRAAAPSRRRVLQAAAGAGLAAALPCAPGAGRAGGADVAVVGAGIAGLYVATVLAAKGAQPTVFEAGGRVGGRVWTLRGVFPGQLAERGADLIDTARSTLRGLAGAYGLTLESYAANKLPGEEAF